MYTFSLIKNEQDKFKFSHLQEKCHSVLDIQNNFMILNHLLPQTTFSRLPYADSVAPDQPAHLQSDLRATLSAYL